MDTNTVVAVCSIMSVVTLIIQTIVIVITQPISKSKR